MSGLESWSSSKLVAYADCRPAATASASSSSSAVAPPLLPAPLLFFSCASCSSASRAFRSRATLPVLASTNALAVSAGLVGGCCSTSGFERRFSCASSVRILDEDAADARRPLCAASVFQPSALEDAWLSSTPMAAESMANSPSSESTSTTGSSSSSSMVMIMAAALSLSSLRALGPSGWSRVATRTALRLSP